MVGKTNWQKLLEDAEGGTQETIREIYRAIITIKELLKAHSVEIETQKMKMDTLKFLVKQRLGLTDHEMVEAFSKMQKEAMLMDEIRAYDNMVDSMTAEELFGDEE